MKVLLFNPSQKKVFGRPFPARHLLNPNPPLGFGSNDSERMRCEAEGAFLQRVYRDVHEQKNAPTTKQIAAMNIAPGSAPVAESGLKQHSAGRDTTANDFYRHLAKNVPLGQVKIRDRKGVYQTEYTYGKDPKKHVG